MDLIRFATTNVEHQVDTSNRNHIERRCIIDNGIVLIWACGIKRISIQFEYMYDSESSIDVALRGYLVACYGVY